MAPQQGKAWIVMMALGTTLVAGCAGTADDDGVVASDPPADLGRPDPALVVDERDLRFDLLATDALPGPTWNVGDRFTLRVRFGSQDTEGTTFAAIAAEAGSDGYLLATDSAEMAKHHARSDYPFLGKITADLTATGFGGTWDLVEFPLTDGKAWKGSIPNIAFDIIESDTVDLDMAATYDASIKAGNGTFPGFTIEGRTATGETVIEMDYVPAIGWSSRFVVHDIDPDQDPLEFEVLVTEVGTGWTGTYYLDTATRLIDNVDRNGFDREPWAGGQPVFDPSPHATFTVPADAEYVLGVIDHFAVIGTRDTWIESPSGELRRYRVTGMPGSDQVVWFDEIALSGLWKIYTAGAGGHSASHVTFWSIDETTSTL